MALESVSTLADAGGHAVQTAENVLPLWNGELAAAVLLAVIGVLAVLAIDWWAEKRT